MSADFRETWIRFHGREMTVRTERDGRTDEELEAAHTLAYFAGFNQLRSAEADLIEGVSAHVAEALRKPWKIHSRENPAGLTIGSDYRGNRRLWRPALPVRKWKAPKPPSDRQARVNADKIRSRDYAPISPGWTADGIPREQFQLISTERLPVLDLLDRITVFEETE